MDEAQTKPDAGGPRYDLPSGGRLLIGWSLILVGAVMLAVGWWGVSGNPLVAAQLAYLASGGLGGLLAGIIGVGLLISNDVRKDRERLGRLEAAVLELRDLLVAQAGELQTSENGAKPGQDVSLSTPAAGRIKGGPS